MKEMFSQQKMALKTSDELFLGAGDDFMHDGTFVSPGSLGQLLI